MLTSKREFCTLFPEISFPWEIRTTSFDEFEEILFIHTAICVDTRLVCPLCNLHCPRYDMRSRRWRHLDTCEYRTIVWGEVPRIKCPEHGCLTIRVPWADPGRRYTNAFEMYVMECLRETPLHAVSRRLGLSRGAINGIEQHAMKRMPTEWWRTRRVG